MEPVFKGSEQMEDTELKDSVSDNYNDNLSANTTGSEDFRVRSCSI